MSENMIFCLGEGQYESKGIGYQQNNMVFNKQVTQNDFSKIKNSLPKIELPITCWIKSNDMSKEEKKNVSGWDEMDGYLKILDYEQAWAKWWSEASQEDKNKILNCEYFDEEVFMGITGIKDFKTPSLKGKEVEVKFDGVTYKAIIQ